jgi:hypothetical protein
VTPGRQRGKGNVTVLLWCLPILLQQPARCLPRSHPVRSRRPSVPFRRRILCERESYRPCPASSLAVGCCSLESCFVSLASSHSFCPRVRRSSQKPIAPLEPRPVQLVCLLSRCWSLYGLLLACSGQLLITSLILVLSGVVLLASLVVEQVDIFQPPEPIQQQRHTVSLQELNFFDPTMFSNRA